MQVSALDAVIRLLVSAILGGLIGLEREIRNQPAGLRTHMIVCIGATLITLVSLHTAAMIPGSDPGRIAAQIVTGIGFLGAGAIIRFGLSIRGLTTAACIWAAAGIGLATGIGYYLGAAFATALILAAALILDRLEKLLIIGKAYKRFTVNVRDVPGIIGKVEAALGRHGVIIRQVGLHKDLIEHKAQVTLIGQTPKLIDSDALSKEVSAIEGVERIDID
jgi:putative Mg2+ transporter-C (MgtC) family protein